MTTACMCLFTVHKSLADQVSATPTLCVAPLLMSSHAAWFVLLRPPSRTHPQDTGPHEGHQRGHPQGLSAGGQRPGRQRGEWVELHWCQVTIVCVWVWIDNTK